MSSDPKQLARPSSAADDPRFLPPLLLTGCAAVYLVASFLPWGSVDHPWGFPVTYNGWHEFLSVGGWQLHNSLVALSVCLSAVLAWLRVTGVLKMPWVVPLLLTAYACGHVAWAWWFFASGRAVRLTGPPSLAASVGTGAYVALAACAAAFLVCLVMLFVPRTRVSPGT
jgi:hypothetical protein